MKKLLLILLTAVTLFSTAAIPASATPPVVPPPTPGDIYAEMQEPGGALEALQVFYLTLSYDEYSGYDFPDDYAGHWLSNTTASIHIALTSGAPEVIARYNEIFAGYEDIVVFETVGFYYSLNELNEIINRVFTALPEAGFPFNNIYPHVSTNKIHIEFLRQFDEAGVRAVLAELIEDMDLFVLYSRTYPALDDYRDDINPRTGISLGLGVILTAGGVLIISRKRK
ncbi:MAG: hypothetical protein FWE60_03445 [Oscillospiraceae bacterium]|nr:hypothetical protein [Oscillospiraceae bacterium]